MFLTNDHADLIERNHDSFNVDLYKGYVNVLNVEKTVVNFIADTILEIFIKSIIKGTKLFVLSILNLCVVFPVQIPSI